MNTVDIFYLYLLPWGVMLVALIAITGVFWLAEKVSGFKLHRPKNLVAGAVAAALAFICLKYAFTHGYEGLPTYLKYSIISYGLSGAVLAWGAAVELGALLSEQVDNAKRALVAADRAEK